MSETDELVSLLDEVDPLNDCRTTLSPTPGGVITLFFRKVIEELEEERRELHLTDLVYECPRKLWYNKKKPLMARDDEMENLLRMWQGKMLHKMPLTANHEMELEYMGVKTSIDEYDPETKTVIEKKFVNFVPRNERELRKYFEHYVLQVKLEALFLQENGYEVKNAFLLFVKRGNPEGMSVNCFRIEVNVQKMREEFERRLKTATDVLSRDEPPDVPETYTPFDYPCSYCSYRKRCYYGVEVVE